MERALELACERLNADTMVPTPRKRAVAYAVASSTASIIVGSSLTIDLLARGNGGAALVVSALTTLAAAGAAIVGLRLWLARWHTRRTDTSADTSDSGHDTHPSGTESA